MKKKLAFSQFLFLITILFSFVPTFAGNPKYQLLTPNLSEPINLEENISQYSMLTWDETPGADKYLIEISYDKSFSNLEYASLVPNKYLKFNLSQPNTNYYWRVKAYNSTDSSDYSVIYSFKTIDTTNSNMKLHCRKAKILRNMTSPTIWYSSKMFFDNKNNMIISGEYDKEFFLTADIGFIDPDYGEGNKITSSYIAIFDSLGAYKYGLNFAQGQLTLNSVATDSDGNSYLVGSFSNYPLRFSDSISIKVHSNPYGSKDGFIAKINKVGICEWAKDIGNYQWDDIRLITLDKYENIWILGSLGDILYHDTVDFGNGIKLAGGEFIAKYDKSGKCLLAKNKGELADFVIDRSNNFIFSGYLYQNQDSINVFDKKVYIGGDTAKKGFVAKIDSNFNLIWLKRINIYIPGYSFRDDIYSINLNINSRNEILINTCFNKSSKEDAINLNFAGGDYDTYITLLDSNGKHKWLRNYSGNRNELISCARFDKNDNVYLSCTFNSDSLYLNETKLLRKNITFEASRVESILAIYDRNGNLISYLKNNNTFNAIRVDGLGRIHSCGTINIRLLDFGDNFKFNTTDRDQIFWVEYGSRNAPDIPILKYPVEAGEVFSKDLTLSCYDSPNANKYEFLVANDAKFQNIILKSNSELRFMPIERDLLPGVYYWKVRAVNELGTSDWSEVRRLTIIKNEILHCLAKKCFSSDSLKVVRMACDDFGNYYFIGSYSVPELKLSDSISLKKKRPSSNFLLKYNKAGICQWAKNIEASNWIEFYDLKVNNKGEAIVAGRFPDSLFVDNFSMKSLNFTRTAVFYIKYDSTGKNVYTKQYDAGEINSLEITPDPFGNLNISGLFSCPTITFDPGFSLNNKIINHSIDLSSSYSANFDKNGNCVNCKLISDNSFIPYPAIKYDKNGNKFIFGTFKSLNLNINDKVELRKNINDYEELYIVKFDSTDNYLWHKTISNDIPFVGYDYYICNNGDINLIVLFGGVSNFTIDSALKLQSNTDYSIFVLKYDSLGNLKNRKFISSANLNSLHSPPDFTGKYDISIKLKTAEDDGFYLTGMFASCYIDFGNNKLLDPGSLSEIYLARFDSSLNCLSSKAIRGMQTEKLKDVYTDKNNNLYILGNSDSPFINLGDTNKIVNPQKDSFIFWAKFGPKRNIDYPSLIAPAHNKNLIDTKPKFVWSKVNLAQNYEIEISTDSKFYNIITMKVCADTTITPDKELAKNTLYFWKVRAFNDKDTSESSEVRAFYISDNSEVIEVADKECVIYPNPTCGIIKYDILTNKENLSSIRVFDFTGQNVLYIKNPSLLTSGELDLSALSSGNYSIIFETSTKKIFSKIAVQK